MKKEKLKVGLLLALLSAGMASFLGCNNTGFPTNASDPNQNSLIPQPPETQLTTSIAFSGIAMNGDNAFAFVALQPLSTATTLYFTDGGWDDNTSSLIGGHILSFTPSQALPAGTQVLIAEGQAAASIILNDSIAGVAGAISTDGTPGDGMGLSKSGSDLIAYMIPSAGATQFLTALSNNPNHPFLTSGAGSKANTYVPPGLKVGVTAIDLFKLQGENDVFGNCGVFQFPAQVSATQLLAVLINPVNWVVAPGGSTSVSLPGKGVKMCDFTAVIKSVPTAVVTPWTGASPTPSPTPCGYPGPTCTPVPASPPTAGSIAFTGLTYNGNSQISFVNTTALPSSQVIYFTNYSYDATANSGAGGLVDESFTDGSTATTVVEGIISYTAPAAELAAYSQVVIGNTNNETNQLQGGAVANVAGGGGNPWLVQNHNGFGHKVLAYSISGGVTTWLGAVIFGPDAWQTAGPITTGNCWDSYLPPGLDSTTSIDLHGVWGADNLNQYNNSSDQNDNAVLQNCWSDLADIVNPGHWIADGNQSKTKVGLSPVVGLTAACGSGSGGYTGSLP